MDRNPLERLRDARDQASWLLQHASTPAPHGPEPERRDRPAVPHGLMIIGEALGKVPDEVKGPAPDIPWRAIVAMRNQIVHSCSPLDPEGVAAVVTTHLNPLVDAPGRLIARAMDAGA
jgi:uncharacterized protein with HEPN domain